MVQSEQHGSLQVAPSEPPSDTLDTGIALPEVAAGRRASVQPEPASRTRLPKEEVRPVTYMLLSASGDCHEL